eukprot:3818760-Rhodomonas_salina.7
MTSDDVDRDGGDDDGGVGAGSWGGLGPMHGIRVASGARAQECKESEGGSAWLSASERGALLDALIKTGLRLEAAHQLVVPPIGWSVEAVDEVESRAMSCVGGLLRAYKLSCWGYHFAECDTLPVSERARSQSTMLPDGPQVPAVGPLQRAQPRVRPEAGARPLRQHPLPHPPFPSLAVRRGERQPAPGASPRRAVPHPFLRTHPHNTTVRPLIELSPSAAPFLPVLPPSLSLSSIIALSPSHSLACALPIALSLPCLLYTSDAADDM